MLGCPRIALTEALLSYLETQGVTKTALLDAGMRIHTYYRMIGLDMASVINDNAMVLATVTGKTVEELNAIAEGKDIQLDGAGEPADMTVGEPAADYVAAPEAQLAQAVEHHAAAMERIALGLERLAVAIERRP
jgi:hypothetical protein